MNRSAFGISFAFTALVAASFAGELPKLTFEKMPELRPLAQPGSSSSKLVTLKNESNGDTIVISIGKYDSATAALDTISKRVKNDNFNGVKMTAVKPSSTKLGQVWGYMPSTKNPHNLKITFAKGANLIEIQSALTVYTRDGKTVSPTRTAGMNDVKYLVKIGEVVASQLGK